MRRIGQAKACPTNRLKEIAEKVPVSHQRPDFGGCETIDRGSPIDPGAFVGVAFFAVSCARSSSAISEACSLLSNKQSLA